MVKVFNSHIASDGLGERLLLIAIIRRAAFDIALYRDTVKPNKKRIWKEAYDWIMSDLDDYFTSFVNICNVLNKNPKEIRRKTLKMGREHVKKYDRIR
jgi:hypothetical protein